ncbi:glycosyltransferase family 4 protein [Chryseobacterium sp. Alg-005]|uniref:glycosyltransferase family 4 protein n=1 Tax=Chryseobacterium sp. Alg-005 TaxID=3159516 RepID=UPI0036F2BF40
MAKLFKRKVIAHQFGANYEGFYNSQSPFLQKKIKNTIEKTDYFIVEGDYTKKQLSFVKDYENKVVSIPNGLPQKVKSDIIKPKNISEPIVILYLSNMIEGKGFWDVLEAGNLLYNKYNKNIKLIFAGRFLEDLEDTLCKTSEEARDLFSKKLKEYNLSDKTVYYEGLYGAQKEEAFLNAHFFILPSYYINEGQPVSVLEAIAYGCVPIVTEYRLIPSMVNNENGFFVKPKSPEEIAEKILESDDAPGMYRKKSENGIAFYEQNFTAEKYVSQILKLF